MTVNVLNDPVYNISKHFPGLLKIQRALAWLRRLLSKSNEIRNYLTTTEILRAGNILVNQAQRVYYSRELQTLLHSSETSKSNSLSSLKPCLNTGGIMRDMRVVDEISERPIIIPHVYPIATAVMMDAYNLAHAVMNWTFCIVRQSYW